MSMRFRTLLGVIIFGAISLVPPCWLPVKTTLGCSQWAYAMTALSSMSFRERVSVNGPRVKLVDLFEPGSLPEDWQLYLAGIDIGPAPEGYSIKTINMENLRIYVRQLLESHGLNPDQVSVKIPERISIELRKQVISTGQIEEIVRQHIIKTTSAKPEDVQVQTLGLEQPLVVPDGTLTWEIQNPLHDPDSDSTALNIQFSVNGSRVLSSRVVSKVEVFRKVVCAARALKRDEIVGADDLRLLRINVAHHPERFRTDLDQVVGKRLTANVAANQPIDAEMLDKAVTVKRGSTVIVLYHREGLSLTAKGQAKEDGTLGDTVKVINTDSKRSLLCRVIDPHTVEVVH